jgi:hypothetical protein
MCERRESLSVVSLCAVTQLYKNRITVLGVWVEHMFKCLFNFPSLLDEFRNNALFSNKTALDKSIFSAVLFNFLGRHLPT